MKYIVLLPVLLLVFGKSIAQPHLNISFEAGDTLMKHHVFIDGAYPNNKWQVGTPMKPVFNHAFSGTRVIATDTAGPYMPNDTSVFYYKAARQVSHPGAFLQLNFKYWLHMDTSSRAFIEFLIMQDTNEVWLNLTDTPYVHGQLGNGPNVSAPVDTPDLSRSTNGWRSGKLYIADVISHMGQPWGYYRYPDTLQFRFTFISGSSFTTPGDGWMLDDLSTQYFWSNISDLKKNLISFYPNPSTGTIYLNGSEATAKSTELIMYNLYGQEVYRLLQPALNNPIQLPVAPGTYWLKYIAGKVYDAATIVIQ